MEWTGEPVEILMGELTYGYKIKAPTREAGVKGWIDRFHPLEDFHSRYSGWCDYDVGGERYKFQMGIAKPDYYESVSMAEKALKKEIDKIREKLDSSWSIEFETTGSDPRYDDMDVVNKTHMIAHLFDMTLKEEIAEETIKQLNGSKIPDGLKSAFKSSNSPLSAKASVAQTGAENYWYIVDGIERYAVWKQEDQLNVWSCCKRVDVLLQNTERERLGMCSYLVKGPVVYLFECFEDDMIYDDMVEKYFDPMLRSFQPIAEIT